MPETVSGKKTSDEARGLCASSMRWSIEFVMKSKVSLPSDPPRPPVRPIVAPPDHRPRECGGPESLRAQVDPFYEAGREMRAYVDKRHSGHFALGWVGERMARDFRVYFPRLRDIHLELALLNPGTPEYKCGLALDVWWRYRSC